MCRERGVTTVGISISTGRNLEAFSGHARFQVHRDELGVEHCYVTIL